MTCSSVNIEWTSTPKSTFSLKHQLRSHTGNSGRSSPTHSPRILSFCLSHKPRTGHRRVRQGIREGKVSRKTNRNAQASMSTKNSFDLTPILWCPLNVNHATVNWPFWAIHSPLIVYRPCRRTVSLDQEVCHGFPSRIQRLFLRYPAARSRNATDCRLRYPFNMLSACPHRCQTCSIEPHPSIQLFWAIRANWRRRRRRPSPSLPINKVENNCISTCHREEFSSFKLRKKMKINDLVSCSQRTTAAVSFACVQRLETI